MNATAREVLTGEIAQLVSARLLWAVLPARHALNLEGRTDLADLVSWAVGNVTEDVRTILIRYDVQIAESRDE